MQARGPLMIEHRLIEQVISIIGEALVRIEKFQTIDPMFVDTVVDFLKIYADRTHHGKEEEILFRELRDKDLSAADQRVMTELIEEHKSGRKMTKALVDANTRFTSGDIAALKDVLSFLGKLIEFYPKHIEKEDKVFFPAARAYFSDAEDQALLAKFWEFDRKMIHEKYTLVVEGLKL